MAGTYGLIHGMNTNYLERDKFEELVTMMIDAYPDHELTEWLKRGFV